MPGRGSSKASGASRKRRSNDNWPSFDMCSEVPEQLSFSTGEFPPGGSSPVSLFEVNTNAQGVNTIPYTQNCSNRCPLCRGRWLIKHWQTVRNVLMSSRPRREKRHSPALGAVSLVFIKGAYRYAKPKHNISPGACSGLPSHSGSAGCRDRHHARARCASLFARSKSARKPRRLFQRGRRWVYAHLPALWSGQSFATWEDRVG